MARRCLSNVSVIRVNIVIIDIKTIQNLIGISLLVFIVSVENSSYLIPNGLTLQMTIFKSTFTPKKIFQAFELHCQNPQENLRKDSKLQVPSRAMNTVNITVFFQ